MDFCFDGSRRGTALHRAAQCRTGRAVPRHHPFKTKQVIEKSYLGFPLCWKMAKIKSKTNSKSSKAMTIAMPKYKLKAPPIPGTNCSI